MNGAIEAMYASLYPDGGIYLSEAAKARRNVLVNAAALALADWFDAAGHQPHEVPGPVIANRIREAVGVTTAVSPPDDDAGLSWSGFNLRGDRKSIKEVQRLLHREYLCTDLEKIVIEQRARVDEQERLVAGYQRECDEVEQLLGKALGYPLADHTICARCDPVTGCTCGTPIVVVGEHTPASIAADAANRVAELERQNAALVAAARMVTCHIRRDVTMERSYRIGVTFGGGLTRDVLALDDVLAGTSDPIATRGGKTP